jgi:hypothetical protein
MPRLLILACTCCQSRAISDDLQGSNMYLGERRRVELVLGSELKADVGARL